MEYLQKLKELVDDLIGLVDLKITGYSKIPKKGKRMAYYLNLSFIFSDVLMNGLGLKAGHKTISDVCLPSMYTFASKENPSQVMLVATMLRWLFSGDGYISVFSDHLGQTHRVIGISFTKRIRDPDDRSPPRLLIQTAYLLKEMFGIRYNGPYAENNVRSYVFKGVKINTVSWRIFIRGYENLKKFNDNIGFVEFRKNKLLRQALNSYQRPKMGDRQRFEAVLMLAKDMKWVTAPMVADNHRISLKWAGRLLKLGREEGYLRVSRVAKFSNKSSHYIYEWIGEKE